MKYDSYHAYVLDHFDEGSTILELGSGINTGLFATKFEVYTVEQDTKYLDLVPDINYIYAPIQRDGWYNVELLQIALPDLYDVVIVDGPKGGMYRRPLLNHLDLFNTEVPWIFDDVNRRNDKAIMTTFCLRLGKHSITFEGKDRSFAVVL